MSPGIENEIIIALRRITRAIDLHSRGLLHEYGMTVPQLAALHAAGELQPVSMSALARAIHVSQATLTGILDRLERRHLVQRVRSGTDRRSLVVELTAQGRELLESAPSLLQDRFRCELTRLRQWEQTQMLATLQRIASMMDAERMETVSALSTDAPAEEVESKYVNESAGLTEIAAGPDTVMSRQPDS